jgi:hypothetical protein
MLETLIVARAVLYGRSSQPFPAPRALAGRSTYGRMSDAVRNVALRMSRWVNSPTS